MKSSATTAALRSQRSSRFCSCEGISGSTLISGKKGMPKNAGGLKAGVAIRKLHIRVIVPIAQPG